MGWPEDWRWQSGWRQARPSSWTSQNSRVVDDQIIAVVKASSPAMKRPASMIAATAEVKAVPPKAAKAKAPKAMAAKTKPAKSKAEPRAKSETSSADDDLKAEEDKGDEKKEEEREEEEEEEKGGIKFVVRPGHGEQHTLMAIGTESQRQVLQISERQVLGTTHSPYSVCCAISDELLSYNNELLITEDFDALRAEARRLKLVLLTA